MLFTTLLATVAYSQTVLHDSFRFPEEHKFCIVILDLAKNHYERNDPDRCAERLSPWSTFKIPNSLISLELGIVPDTTQVTKWDGVVRERPEWNHDQNLMTAFLYSAVWYYQRLARETGETHMRDYLHRIHYGRLHSNLVAKRAFGDHV
jgi:beta-lactamase class D